MSGQEDRNVALFLDTPLLAAKRRAFDTPTQANLDALIDIARGEAHYDLFDAVNCLTAENEKLKSGWRPIETAPTGVDLLVSEGRFRVRVAYYHFGRCQWVTVPGEVGIHPTHWMPLPEPPK